MVKAPSQNGAFFVVYFKGGRTINNDPRRGWTRQSAKPKRMR